MGSHTPAKANNTLIPSLWVIVAFTEAEVLNALIMPLKTPLMQNNISLRFAKPHWMYNIRHENDDQKLKSPDLLLPRG